MHVSPNGLHFTSESLQDGIWISLTQCLGKRFERLRDNGCRSSQRASHIFEHVDLIGTFSHHFNPFFHRARNESPCGAGKSRNFVQSLSGAIGAFFTCPSLATMRVNARMSLPPRANSLGCLAAKAYPRIIKCSPGFLSTFDCLVWARSPSNMSGKLICTGQASRHAPHKLDAYGNSPACCRLCN